MPATTQATTAVAFCLQHLPCALAPVSQKVARLYLFHLDDHTLHPSAAQFRIPHTNNSAPPYHLFLHLFKTHQSTPQSVYLSPHSPLTTLLAFHTPFPVPHLPQPRSQQRLPRHHIILKKKHIHEHTAHPPQ